MKKQYRMILFALFLLLFILFLCGCSKYISKYKAIGFVHSNTSRSAFMDFFQFEGSMVFKLQYKDGEQIDYSAKLETGDIKVYYDSTGTKAELFSIHDGEEADSDLDLSGSGTVYIIVQTNGKCQNGDFHFDIK